MVLLGERLIASLDLPRSEGQVITDVEPPQHSLDIHGQLSSTPSEAPVVSINSLIRSRRSSNILLVDTAPLFISQFATAGLVLSPALSPVPR